jgi:hypothetical protein
MSQELIVRVAAGRMVCVVLTETGVILSRHKSRHKAQQTLLALMGHWEYRGHPLACREMPWQSCARRLLS